MKFTSIILLITFSLSSIFSCWTPLQAQEKEAPKLTLGVLPFAHAGVKQHEAISLSNRLHSAIVKTNQFRVVEIDRVEDILNEMGLQQTGVCTDAECVVQVGNLLGARWMTAGSIGLVGRTYTIDIRIIDVETRQVILTISRNYQGEIDGLLKLMNDIAKELAERTQLKLKTGSLQITSEPENALVYLNDELKGRTPLLLQDIEIGEYTVKLKMGDYLNFTDDVVIEPLKQKQINAELKKLWSLNITSIPENAQLYINNKRIGFTPFNRKLPEGTYKLNIKKENYDTHEEHILLTSDKHLNLTLKRKLPLKPNVTINTKENITKIPKNQKQSRKNWLWVVGGIAVVGGTVFLLSVKDDSNKKENVIGTPPDVPNNK